MPVSCWASRVHWAPFWLSTFFPKACYLSKFNVKGLNVYLCIIDIYQETLTVGCREWSFIVAGQLWCSWCQLMPESRSWWLCHDLLLLLLCRCVLFTLRLAQYNANVLICLSICGGEEGHLRYYRCRPVQHTYFTNIVTFFLYYSCILCIYTVLYVFIEYVSV